MTMIPEAANQPRRGPKRLQDTISVRLTAEVRESSHPWGSTTLHVVFVDVVEVERASQEPLWQAVVVGNGATRWRSAPLPLELHWTQATGYRLNLAAETQVFAVLRPDEESEIGFSPLLVTLCPLEAQVYSDCGEDVVEALLSPAALTARLQAFVERLPAEEAFVKRKRGAKAPNQSNAAGADPFWRLPPIQERK